MEMEIGRESCTILTSKLPGGMFSVPGVGDFDSSRPFKSF
jgi:hypothetical protein